MIGEADGDAPVVLARFDAAVQAERAIEALLEAGIPGGSIDGPTPRTSAIAVRAPGRSDRYFIAETMRELGGTVQIVEPAAAA
jgi:hypothetical protein